MLQRRRLEGWRLYCNTADCIARMCSLLGEIVLQEGQVYCNRGSLVAEETVLQYSLVGIRFVLQYKLNCEPGVGLCRATARARQLGALGTAGVCVGALGARQGRWRAARGTEDGVRGAQAGVGACGAAGGRWVGAGARGVRAHGRDRRAAAGAGARGARLAGWPGRAGWPGLCTWCTWPVLGPV